jgi:primary-amine oxidase
MSSKNLVGAYKLKKQLGYLNADDVNYAAGIAKSRHPELRLQFIEINSLEITKDELVNCFLKGVSVQRRAEVITQSLELNQTLIDTIQLPPFDVTEVGDALVLKHETKILQDVQAGLSPDEYSFVEALCRSYQPLLDAIAKRGLDPKGLVADAWCCGHTGPDCDPTERICWPSLYYFDEDVDTIPYGRPIEGIEIRISLTHKKIIRFEDNALGVFPIPGSHEGFNSIYVKPEDRRKDLKPIVITQPEGVSFQVTDGTTVEWQHWRFQVGFSSREGAFLSGVTFFDRSVLHRMSFCEMVRYIR